MWHSQPLFIALLFSLAHKWLTVSHLDEMQSQGVKILTKKGGKVTLEVVLNYPDYSTESSQSFKIVGSNLQNEITQETIKFSQKCLRRKAGSQYKHVSEHFFNKATCLCVTISWDFSGCLQEIWRNSKWCLWVTESSKKGIWNWGRIQLRWQTLFTTFYRGKEWVLVAQSKKGDQNYTASYHFFFCFFVLWSPSSPSEGDMISWVARYRAKCTCPFFIHNIQICHLLFSTMSSILIPVLGWKSWFL